MELAENAQSGELEYLNAVPVLKEINRQIVGQVPQCKAVYIDLCPQDFERPSVLIQLTESETTPSTLGTYERTDKFLIVCYDKVGDRYDTQTLRLLEMRERVLAIFLPGYLRVGDRAPTICAKAVERDFDKAFIEVTATYREALPPQPQLPLMRDVTLNFFEEDK